jgi:Protein of unknown function (DUF3822)
MKPEISIKNPSFEYEKLAEYALYLQTDGYDVQYIVQRVADKEVMLLKDYTFPTALNTDQQIQVLEKVYELDWFLKANFWHSIHISLPCIGFTLVPVQLYQANRTESYLQWVSPKLDDKHSIYSTPIVKLKSQLVAQLRGDFMEFFEGVYPQAKLQYYAQTEAMLKHISHQYQRTKEAQVIVHINNQQVMIGVWRNEKLILLNQYHCPSAQDVVYFVLLVMDELRIERETCPVELLGKISPVSEIVHLLKNYIRHLNIGQPKPEWLGMNPDFDNVAYHYYSDLFALAL